MEALRISTGLRADPGFHYPVEDGDLYTETLRVALEACGVQHTGREFVKRDSNGAPTILMLFNVSLGGMFGSLFVLPESLMSVHIAYCGMTSLPSLTGTLSALKILDLISNKLESLPDSIGDLSALEMLHASDNMLSELPDTIRRLPRLRCLQVEGNRFSEFPQSALCPSLVRINLGRNRIESVPGELFQMQHLETLDLHDNRITSLPDGAEGLRSLKVLLLRGNMITMLPSDFGGTKSLILLDLAKNRLQRLPESIGQLANLRTLILSENPIDELPSEIGRVRLEWIDLDKTGVVELPRAAAHLTRRTRFDLFRRLRVPGL